MSRRTKPLLAIVFTAFVVLAVGAPAYAHVTVNPNEASKGGFVKLAFRVPNEEADATTTKVEVAFPTDNPLAFVSVQPTAGWSYTVEKETLAEPIQSDDGEVTEAVSRIVWTSESADSAIKAGEFQEFNVSVGPLPDADQLVFKALQTYSNGEVVSWIQLPDASGGEVERPAPILTLTAGEGDGHGAATTTTAAATEAEATSSSSDSSDSTARALAIIGIVAGAIGIGTGVVLSRRRPA